MKNNGVEDREIEEFMSYMLTHPEEDPFNKKRARKSSGYVGWTALLEKVLNFLVYPIGIAIVYGLCLISPWLCVAVVMIAVSLVVIFQKK